MAKNVKVEEVNEDLVGRVTEVKVRLTAAQCRYLGGLVDATHAEAPWDPVDTTLTFYPDQEKMWFIAEQTETEGQEGSGVWVDEHGSENHGPTG